MSGISGVRPAVPEKGADVVHDSAAHKAEPSEGASESSEIEMTLDDDDILDRVFPGKGSAGASETTADLSNATPTTADLSNATPSSMVVENKAIRPDHGDASGQIHASSSSDANLNLDVGGTQEDGFQVVNPVAISVGQQSKRTRPNTSPPAAEDTDSEPEGARQEQHVSTKAVAGGTLKDAAAAARALALARGDLTGGSLPEADSDAEIEAEFAGAMSQPSSAPTKGDVAGAAAPLSFATPGLKPSSLQATPTPAVNTSALSGADHVVGVGTKAGRMDAKSAQHIEPAKLSIGGATAAKEAPKEVEQAAPPKVPQPSPPTAVKPAAPAGAPSLLEDLMRQGVESVEATQNADAKKGQLVEEPPAKEPCPEPSTNSAPPPVQTRGRGAIPVTRPDPFDEALKLASAGAAHALKSDAPSALATGTAANVLKGDALAGLRKAYDGGQPSRGGTVPSTDVAASCEGGRHFVDESADEQSGGEAAEQEWEGIEARTQEMRLKEKDRIGVAPKDDGSLEPIKYKDVEQWLKTLDVDMNVLEAQYGEMVESGGCGCMGGRRRKGDVPGLDRRWSSEKDKVLYLRILPFDFNDPIHFRMLRTMFTKLTRSKVCPAIGSHWEIIGFQGGDPRTDLNRSGCVLNVFHMFYFFTHYFDIMKDAKDLSMSPDQHFPLACVSINITRFVIDAFLKGYLSSLCKGGVLEATCKVYCGGIYYFAKQWRCQQRKIEHTDLTFKEIQKLLKTPSKLLNELDKGEKKKKAQSDPSRLEFTELEFGTARGAQAAAPKSKAKAAPVPKRLRNYNAGPDEG